MKKIQGVYSVLCGYWVGDGFLVCLMFSYQFYGMYLSLFLLFDYVGFVMFELMIVLCGVGQYLYCGFEMVMIVYDGEVVYCDLIGVGGMIGLGDVQWMMVVSGILYEEFYLEVFMKQGGLFEMVQLWVNLFVVDKMGVFGYQMLLNVDILVVELLDGVGWVWIIVGEFDGWCGLVCMYMLIDVWDVWFVVGGYVWFLVVEGWMFVVVVLSGIVQVNGEMVVCEVQFV